MLRLADAAMILVVATLGCRSQSLSAAHKTFDTESYNLDNHVDGSSSSLHIFRHAAPWLELNNVFVRGHRATATETHDVVFQVKQRNMDVLTKILHEISDPDHLNYGNHMTMEEINDISSNPDSHDEIIHYMKEAGATHLFDANGGQSIGFRGSIALWERVFNTEFYSLESVANANSNSHVIDPKKFIRSEKYSLPKSLHAHVGHVSKTIDVPTEFLLPHRISTVKTPKYTRMKELGSGTIIRPYLTPERLNQIYDIDDNTGHPRATQAAFEGWGQLYSPDDLKKFQVEMGVPIMPLNYSNPTYEATVAECLARRDYCAEANLDYQYLTSISWSPTLHHFRLETRFTEWITTMAQTAKVPYVITISYGSEESYFDIGELGLFDEGAIKLGLRGVTIIAASGDDGAAPRTARWDSSKCQYMASFPSSSAYVTSVGGTQGLEIDLPEVVCQNDKGGGITSGGGFSIKNAVPSYQLSSIDRYFAQVENGLIKAPYPGYGSGRGVPDVSLAATAYIFILGGEIVGAGGTSVSCPVMGGMVSLVNAARLRAGGKPLGWLNPALYAYADIFINDVVSGDNSVTAGGIVCKQGFHAGPGWDPVSGLGSINFKKFKIQMLKIANITYTGPSSAPTFSPSGPTRSPTIALTRIPVFPVIAPSLLPSPPARTPSSSPSATPSSVRPSLLPSAKPIGTPSTQPTPPPTPLPSSSPSSKPSPVPSRQPTPAPSAIPSTPPVLPSNSLSSPYPTATVTSTPSRSPSASPVPAVITLQPTPSAIVPTQVTRAPTNSPVGRSDDMYYYYYDYVAPTAKPTRRPNRFRQPTITPSQPPR